MESIGENLHYSLQFRKKSTKKIPSHACKKELFLCTRASFFVSLPNNYNYPLYLQQN